MPPPDVAASPPRRLMRAHAVCAFDQRDTTTLLGADGVARTFTGDTAALAREVLAHLVTPRTPDEVRAHVAELSGTPVAPGGVVDELLALLRSAGAVLEVPAAAASAPRRAAGEPAAGAHRRARVVLGLTGAVATALAPDLAMRLLERGYEVRVAATAHALRFVTATALEAITHEPVYSRMYRRAPREPAPHIQLAEWADAVLVCPATARMIARLAHGETADVVSATAIATRAPVLVVPSMNAAMYTAPAVQRNLAQLRDDGFRVVHAAHGHEVAHRPADRAPMYGTAPPWDLVVRLLALALAGATPRGAAASPGAAPYVPRTAQQWDEVYRAAPLASLPWHTDAPDPDLLAAVTAVAPPGGTLLDVGTGTGVLAVAAAGRGLRVTGTDVSARALEHARARADAAGVGVRLERDDVLDSRLSDAAAARFDVVTDRGCLHLLPREQHAAYVASVARRVRPGGALVLKVHSAEEPGEHGTTRFTRDEVRALFAPHFTLERAEPSAMPGPRGAPRALLCVLRRTETWPR